MYAKLIHPNKIMPADERVLRAGGRIIVHPTPADFLANGYYPVVGLDTVPEEGSYRYTLEDDCIHPTRIGGIL